MAQYDNDGPNPAIIEAMRRRKEIEARNKARQEKERRRTERREKLLAEAENADLDLETKGPPKK